MDPIKEMLKRESRELVNLPRNLYINDDSLVNPFYATSEIINTAYRKVRGCHSSEQKARSLYGWMEENIVYEKIGGIFGPRYRHAKEVFEEKKGICGEMTFLYVTMARVVGVEAAYVDVKRDFQNKKVGHACAQVKTEEGRKLVDPAYHSYDINHRQYKVLNDAETIDLFKQLRSKGYYQNKSAGDDLGELLEKLFSGLRRLSG